MLTKDPNIFYEYYFTNSLQILHFNLIKVLFIIFKIYLIQMEIFTHPITSFEVLDIFIEYLMRNISQQKFLIKDNYDNPYLEQAKADLLNFQKNMRLFAIYQQITSEKKIKESPNQQIQKSKISEDEREQEKISQYQSKNSDILIDLVFSNKIETIDRAKKQQQSKQINNVISSKIEIAPKKSKPPPPVANQSHSIYQLEEDPKDSTCTAEESQSLLTMIHHLIGEYLLQVLPEYEINALRNTIRIYDHAQYFKIEAHRSRVFSFFQNLIKKIESLFQNQSQIPNIKIDIDLVKIGKNLMEYFNEVLIQNFKWSLENESKSYVRNPKIKSKMFRALQFLFREVQNCPRTSK